MDTIIYHGDLKGNEEAQIIATDIKLSLAAKFIDSEQYDKFESMNYVDCSPYMIMKRVNTSKGIQYLLEKGIVPTTIEKYDNDENLVAITEIQKDGTFVTKNAFGNLLYTESKEEGRKYTELGSAHKNIEFLYDIPCKNTQYSTNTFAFYAVTDCYYNDYLEGHFLTEDGWHALHFGQNLLERSSQSHNEYEVSFEVYNKYITDMQTNRHIMDDQGKIYYKEKNKLAEDTGFTRDCGGSHLDSAYIFKDSFVIDNKEDTIGDPDNDVYGSENITKNKLYKRQEDGSYKQIWESEDCIFQKEGFPDNVYFSRGSWRDPEAKNYFIDGTVDENVKLTIDLAIKSERKNCLPENQVSFSGLEAYAKIGDFLQFKMNEIRVKLSNNAGKTGDSHTGDVTSEHRSIARKQTDISKHIMLLKKKRDGK